MTLGAFSEPAQREILKDEYPILLVPGNKVATELIAAAMEAGCPNLEQYIQLQDGEYENHLADRKPEEILHE